LRQNIKQRVNNLIGIIVSEHCESYQSYHNFAKDSGKLKYFALGSCCTQLFLQPFSPMETKTLNLDNPV